jgi:hypothetical protein
MSHFELIGIKVPNENWLGCVTRGNDSYLSITYVITVLNSRAAILPRIAPAPSDPTHSAQAMPTAWRYTRLPLSSRIAP